MLNTVDNKTTLPPESATQADAPVADVFRATADSRACVAAPNWLTKPFRSISLERLNAKADMLQRIDNKYVIRAADLERAMPELAKYFDILEIEGRRDFTYETCYFDDAERTNYFDQHRGRRKRCKVRMRKYVEAGVCFVEVKLKARRSITIKQRMACAPVQYGALNGDALTFVHDAYSEQYDRDYGLTLEPVVDMRYKRVTLVAREGGERMTVDFSLKFTSPSESLRVEDGVFLVETKSANANGIADKILRALHLHPTEGCSKYCVAMAALKEVTKYNKFLVALRKLDILPADDANGFPGVNNVQPMARAAAFQPTQQAGAAFGQRVAHASRC